MRYLLLLAAFAAACGDDAPTNTSCHNPPEPFAAGDPTGHADPLHAGPSEARAGRIHANQLPPVSSGLVTWADNDFVLANDKIALVIEAVGDCDFYDPWGGRPVGVARMQGGALVEPANFGEFFILTGRSTVVTDSVSVLNDGSDGNPAVIRARGKLHPVPFFESVISVVYPDALTDDDATSWGYIPANGPMGSALSVSGFLGAFTPGFTIGKCTTTDRLHAQLVIGGPGLDGVVAAVERTRGNAQREITGTITRGGAPAPGVRVHAIDTTSMDAYLARTTTDANGAFTLLVPAGANVRLDAYKRCDALGSTPIGAATPGTIALPATGSLHDLATENAAAVPVRVQVVPAEGQTLPAVPAQYGEDSIASGRLHVEYAVTGDITLPVPPGKWTVIVSRGYEYELVQQTVTVAANATVAVDAALVFLVVFLGVLC